ncbi:MAG: hypothetical protein MJ172_03580 [Clostridia bacterium]|nr:hypothetical protein [Clostridia bacterium]
MLRNSIILPDWLDNKTIFQQGIPFVIEGTAPSSATVTLEIIKDPTDGKSVSKLDTDYGVILSLETTTSQKGKFKFTVPAYKASLDAYTFVFTCLSDTKKITDLRCGDVWVFLGSDFLSIPMNKSQAPQIPFKRKVMELIRFFKPNRNGLEAGEKNISFEPKEHFKDSKWLKITDTTELAEVSSSVFAFAYSLADQIHYPVGIVDLAYENSSIINWISRDSINGITALSDYLESLGLNLDEEKYKKQLTLELNKEKAEKLRKEIKESNSHFDFDLSKDLELSKLTGKSTSDNSGLSLDFPTSDASTLANPGTKTETTEDSKENAENKDKEASSNSNVQSMTRQLDFTFDVPSSFKEEDAKGDLIPLIKRNSIMYNSKLSPLKGMTIRGMCFSPNKTELIYDRYDLLLMGLLDTLMSVFEPHEVEDMDSMPSLLFLAMHPNNVPFDNPYRVLEFNEELLIFTHKLMMPTSIVSCHDLLLPDKTKSFVIGTRLSVVALGIHFTEKLPKASPTCAGVERAGNKLIVTFDNIGDGLKLDEGEQVLRGFSICGEDRIFHPANAIILHGVRVMVWRDDILEPVGVTYGFSPIPHEARFKNLSGLPVLPFRMDRNPSFYASDLNFASCDKLTFIGKKNKDSEFEELKVFRSFKGNGVIATDMLHKTEGEASIKIQYETENSLYGFEPCLEYASLFAPLEVQGKRYILMDVFNPEEKTKRISVKGFIGVAELAPRLDWQMVKLEFNGNVIKLDELKITIEDKSRTGEIYIDNIRFV